MTEEEKQLLIKDLCARLTYGVKCNGVLKQIDGSLKSVFGMFKGYNGWATIGNNLVDIETVKPYLRPLSSMTDEETKYKLSNFFKVINTKIEGVGYIPTLNSISAVKYIDWLNKNHFDYRGLIAMGLAIEAPKDMYN